MGPLTKYRTPHDKVPCPFGPLTTQRHSWSTCLQHSFHLDAGLWGLELRRELQGPRLTQAGRVVTTRVHSCPCHQTCHLPRHDRVPGGVGRVGTRTREELLVGCCLTGLTGPRWTFWGTFDVLLSLSSGTTGTGPARSGRETSRPWRTCTGTSRTRAPGPA